VDVQEQASCDAVKLGLICPRVEATEVSTMVLHIHQQPVLPLNELYLSKLLKTLTTKYRKMA